MSFIPNNLNRCGTMSMKRRVAVAMLMTICNGGLSSSDRIAVPSIHAAPAAVHARVVSILAPLDNDHHHCRGMHRRQQQPAYFAGIRVHRHCHTEYSSSRCQNSHSFKALCSSSTSATSAACNFNLFIKDSNSEIRFFLKYYTW